MRIKVRNEIIYGGTMTKLGFCEACGFKLGGNANFCPKCGTEAVIAPNEEQLDKPVNEKDSQHSEQQEAGTSGRWLIASIVVVLAALVTFALSIQNTSNPGNFSEQAVLEAAGPGFNYVGDGFASSFSGVSCVKEFHYACVDLTIYTSEECGDFEISIGFLGQDSLVVGEKKYLAGFSLKSGEKGKVFLDTRNTPGESLQVQGISCIPN